MIQTENKTYNVKLVMSDEYIIYATTPEEAEEIARGMFGCNYLIDEVIVSEEQI